MARILGRAQRLALTAALAVMVSGVASVAVAATGPSQPRQPSQPSQSAVLSACAQKVGGQLRMLAAGEQCRPSETGLQWNQQGPVGPPGPSIAQIIFRDFERGAHLAPGDVESEAVPCGTGEVVVSGGYILGGPRQPTIDVVLDAPFFDGVTSGWRVDVKNEGPDAVDVALRINLTCTKGSGLSG